MRAVLRAAGSCATAYGAIQHSSGGGERGSLILVSLLILRGHIEDSEARFPGTRGRLRVHLEVIS